MSARPPISERATASVSASRTGHSKPDLCLYCGGPARHRSDPDHGMFWAIIHAACKSWQEDHPFQPTGLDERERAKNLYGWLLVEVGYVDVGSIESHEVHSVNAGLSAARRVVKGKKLHYWRLIETPTGWQLITPKSLDYKSAGKRKYEEVRSEVYATIESVLGVPIEQLKRETQREAA